MPHNRSKGKIDRSEWSAIIARYDAGESIAQIGRDYKCTAPAIRYIIKKSGNLRSEVGISQRPQSGGRQNPPSRGPRAPAPQPETFPSGESSAEKLRATGLTGIFEPQVVQRVSSDIAVFLVALDRAEPDDVESLAVLQKATDSLMRAIARIRIELDRATSSGLPALAPERGIERADAGVRSRGRA